MPRKSIVVVDVIWEFRMPKQYQISTEVARGGGGALIRGYQGSTWTIGSVIRVRVVQLI